MTEREQIEHWFTYHAPAPGQKSDYELLRSSAMAFALIVLDVTPPGPDRDAAIRKVREAVMTANAAIACSGESSLERAHRQGGAG